MTDKHKQCGFEAREALGNQYYNDSRWKIVIELRKNNQQAKASGLVFQIRKDWGLQ